jgi:hypothetical protein
LIKAAGWISPENSMPQWRQIATWHGEIEPDSSISASRETLAQAHKQFEGVVFFFFLSMVSSHHAVRPWLARAPLSVTIISARCCSCLIHSSSGNYKDYFAFGCFHDARRLLWQKPPFHAWPKFSSFFLFYIIILWNWFKSFFLLDDNEWSWINVCMH